MSNSDKTQLLAANRNIDDLIQRVEYEKKRGDILQSQLDSIDDFNACIDEHEVNISRVIN
jgi:hypothetical protein